MANVLVIDDDEMLCKTLCSMVIGTGNEATYASTLQEGVFMATSGAFDAVFLDVCMPDGNGLDVLPRILEAYEAPEVIIITGKGEASGAELAIKAGAWDYLQKPVMVEELEIRLLRALQYHDAKRGRKPSIVLKRDDIIGSSAQIRQCLDLVGEAAGCDANVLIVGETGTGKELFARAIHQNSARSEESFVVVDCASLPENLVESMLFGHDKGAFTGADKAKVGLIQQAHKGTLFLDEVGELPLAVQKSFLRVLQERRFRPLGGNKEMASNFRLVAATNRNLDDMVQEGLFRSDLLFRLKTINIEIPPLRERHKDILELATWRLARLAGQQGMKGISPEFGEALLAYDWPGNVRELFNATERAQAVAIHDPILFQRHLPTYIRVKLAQASISESAPCAAPAIDETRPQAALAAQEFPTFKDYRQAGIEDLERKYLTDLLSKTKGSIKKSCKLANLSRTRLYYLMKKYGLSKKTAD